MEIFAKWPSDLMTRAQLWSNYKHHSTIKFFYIPQVFISYLSPCSGGRMCDKEIVEWPTLNGLLSPGNLVIADRGFMCSDYARMAD